MNRFYSRLQDKRCSNDESGIAMMITVGAILLVSILALHMMVSSRGTSYESSVMAEYSRLKYVAESEAERALLVFHQEQMLKTLAPGNASLIDSSLVLDVPYQVNDDVWIVLSDFANGLSLLPRDILGGQVFGEDLTSDAVDLLNDMLADYVDEDDIPRFRGMERAGYANMNLSGLPRNVPFEYREELLWIPAVREVLQEYCNPGQAVFELFQKIPFAGCPPLRESPTGKRLVAPSQFRWPVANTTTAIPSVEDAADLESLGEDRKFSGVVTVNVYVRGSGGIKRNLTVSRHYRQISGPPINSRLYIMNWEHRK